MKLLVLGGTLFLGRAVVDAALAEGHEVTIFNRGRTNAELFGDVERLRGERDGGLDALRGRSWDAVIDTSGYVPRVVRQSAELLRDAVGRYVFVSTISVYADVSLPYDEDAAVRELEDPASEDVAGDYGALKAACERVLDERYGERATSARAGLIAGPHDPTDRFTYWCLRLAEGGRVLAPGRPERPVQLIDARDLADWLVAVAQRGPAGAVNATGPAAATTLGELLARVAAALGARATLEWVADGVLLDAGVEPWTELPLWIPDPGYDGMMRADISRALAAGLALRPIERTAADTLAWARTADRRAATLTRATERRILSGRV